jgi:hypothetical protein
VLGRAYLGAGKKKGKNNNRRRKEERERGKKERIAGSIVDEQLTGTVTVRERKEVSTKALSVRAHAHTRITQK